ncbi:GntR family transcriptional regulator [Devosia sp. XJ19-1]|uniref:GntR family transcriptional regulator n=1 Tax=Devosia ureilytica TaxID=2952754 RepID=A0A9Q4FT24_9HYPH|nr:GntR family transcriptional regulator [Devosia ureilytica]MCP8883862.1 GntR family transcriptional regulator [Devosia ureilytica]MCP8887470.1 GntR family transcriptional regulator [Devosia ureilytica]
MTGGEEMETGKGEKSSAVETLVREIRAMIDQQTLSVGDALPSERELCERFSTSRNTVREAMRMLKAYGVVDVRPKVGATIIDNRMARAMDLFTFNTLEISRKTFSDIQGYRSLIEVNSVDSVMDLLREVDLVDLTAANEAMRDALTIPEASEADFAFHMRLVRVLDNAALDETYRIMKPIIIRIMEKGKSRQDFRTSTFEQHAAIIDALRARDRIGYQYALKFHLNHGFNTFGEMDGVKSAGDQNRPGV